MSSTKIVYILLQLLRDKISLVQEKKTTNKILFEKLSIKRQGTT